MSDFGLFYVDRHLKNTETDNRLLLDMELGRSKKI